jgi:putative flippase GtrA
MVGSAGTALQLGLFATTSVVLGAQIASIAAWLISTVVTNGAHRALTFGVHGSLRNRSDQVAAFLTSVVGLAVTSAVLAQLTDATGTSGLVAILAVNVVVGAARFVGMRWWLGESGHRRNVGNATATGARPDRGHLAGPRRHARLATLSG